MSVDNIEEYVRQMEAKAARNAEDEAAYRAELLARVAARRAAYAAKCGRVLGQILAGERRVA